MIRRFITSSWFKILVITGSVLGSLGMVSYLVLAIYVASFTFSDQPQTADVIIVPGARAYRQGVFNPCLYGRVEKAAQLLADSKAEAIIVSGGNDYVDSKNESVAMKAMALELEVPEEKILLEPAATSTYENMLYSREIMAEHGFESAIIVSEPFHLARASLVASNLDISHTTSPAYNSPCWQRWTYLSRFFLREPLVIGAYFGLGLI